MSTIDAAFKRHAVPIYFAVVFVISVGGLLLVFGPPGFPLDAAQFASFGLLLYAAILAGPCVAAILLTAIVDGRPGIRDLLTPLRRWRVRWTWYGALPFVILMTMLLSLLPPFRVLLVWVHDRTESLPVVMLMHAAVSFVTLTVRPEGLTATRLLASLLMPPAVMWLLLASVGVAGKWQLSRQPLQTNLVERR